MMKYSTATKVSTIIFFAAFVSACFVPAASAQCPSADKVREGFNSLLNREVTVLKVQPSLIRGLCEVQFKSGPQIDVAYVDPTGNYFVTGHILDVQNQVDLSKELISSLNRLTPKDMKSLESLAVFTAGKSDKSIYYVTDPECPFCKKGEVILKKLIDDGKLSVKFVFYPLPMHKGAEEQCISIICDKKGFDELQVGYKSENQCPEGKKKVEESIAFMHEKHFTGTPIYIFPNGTYHLGVLKERDILKYWDVPEKK
jgi:thiol:disulfide interchange protein DsbC